MADDEEQMLMKFAQKLAGNEKKYRDRALVKFRKWLSTACSSEKAGTADCLLLKIWKGLHYCMWMSDTPLVQEDLANKLAGLVHAIQDPKVAISFIEAYLRTQAREWSGIDHFRIDKFMMLMRRYWCESLVLLKRHHWSEELTARLVDVLRGGVFSGRTDDFPDGVRFFFADIFWDEMEKVAAVDLNEDQVMVMLDPLCLLLSETKSEALQKHLVKRIFEPPLSWEEEDSEEEGDDDEEEEKEKEKVNRCKVNLVRVCARLFELGSDKKCNGKNRTCVYAVVKRYRAVIQGQSSAPMLPDPAQFAVDPIEEVMEEATERLIKSEEKIMKASHNLMSKREKKRLRIMEAEQAEQEDMEEDEDDDDEEHVEPPAKKKKPAPKSKPESPKAATPKKKAEKDGAKDKENGTSTPAKVKKSSQGKSEAASTPSAGQSASPKKSKNSKLAKDSGILVDKNSTAKVNTPEVVKDVAAPKVSLEEIQNSLKNADKNSINGSLSKKMRRKSKTLEIKETGETVLFSSEKETENLKSPASKAKKSKKGEGNPEATKVNSSSSEKTNSLPVEPKENAILTPAKVKKTKRKSLGGSMSEAAASPSVSNETVTEDGEIEILIANKKYKGPEKLTPSKKSKSAAASPVFAKFDTVSKTPPAFVNKAMKKATPTPKASSKKTPKRMLIDEDRMTASEKKRVSFIMARNTAQEFEESLCPSPVPAFNPLSLPDSGILKASPCASPMLTPKQQLFKKRRRSKAADFFLD